MDKLKQQIRQKLIANVIIDKCKNNEYLIFNESWCTQERVIRFTTRFFRELFPIDDASSAGDSVMYEINNGIDSFIVNCVLNPGAVPVSATSNTDALQKILGISKSKAQNSIILKSWDLTRSDQDVNKLFDDFDILTEKTIPHFEQDLKEKLDAVNNQSDEFLEGAETSSNLTKYERNPKARAACLAAHGTACTACGLDFGKVYGPEFAGRIEVHHIIPLSEIGEEYVVDPINDLVPVCPNCHTALHSKPGGFYTIDELKEIKSRNSK